MKWKENQVPFSQKTGASALFIPRMPPPGRDDKLEWIRMQVCTRFRSAMVAPLPLALTTIDFALLHSMKDP